MRFSVTGEQQRNPLLKAIVLLFLAYILLLWVSNGLMYFHKMGLTAGAVTRYYLGSEQDYTQPISYQSLLEISHFHLFSMGILVMVLTHLMLFVPFAVRLKIWLIGLTFFAAVANEAGGWLVRFVHPGFAYFKIGAFLLLELTLAALVIVVAKALIAGSRNAYRDSEQPDREARRAQRHLPTPYPHPERHRSR